MPPAELPPAPLAAVAALPAYYYYTLFSLLFITLMFSTKISLHVAHTYTRCHDAIIMQTRASTETLYMLFDVAFSCLMMLI